MQTCFLAEKKKKKKRLLKTDHIYNSEMFAVAYSIAYNRYTTDRALGTRYLSYLSTRLSLKTLCPPGCLEEWPPDHTYRYPHSFSERATKSEKKTGKSRLAWYYVWHLPSPEDSCGYTALSWTRRSQGKWPSRSIDMAGKTTITSLGKAEMLRSLRHCLRAQSQGHHSIDRLEERDVGGSRVIVSLATIGTDVKPSRGKFRRASLRDGEQRMWGFPSTQMPSRIEHE